MAKKILKKPKKKGAEAGKTSPAGEPGTIPPVDGPVCSTAVAKKKRKKRTADVRETGATSGQELRAPKRRKKKSQDTERETGAKVTKDDDGNVSDDSFFTENKAAKARTFKVWIADLSTSCSEARLRALLEKCGQVARLDMPRNSSGSTGKAFASFYNQEAMNKALKLDGTKLVGQPIIVKPFSSAESWWKEPQTEKAGRDTEKGRDERTAFVGGLPWDMDKETLAEEFKACGQVQTIRMLTHADGTSKGMAFIVFDEAESVEKALVRDGEKFRGRYLRVDRVPFREGGKGRGKGTGKSKGKDGSVDLNTVFVGNLAPTTDEDQLRADFEECGEVQAVRLVRGQDGRFRGAAFVVYKEHWAAEKALEWDAQDYNGRTLKVAQAKKGGGRGGTDPSSSKE